MKNLLRLGIFMLGALVGMTADAAADHPTVRVSGHRIFYTGLLDWAGVKAVENRYA